MVPDSGVGEQTVDDALKHPLFLLAGLTLLFQEAKTSRSKDSVGCPRKPVTRAPTGPVGHLQGQTLLRGLL